MQNRFARVGDRYLGEQRSMDNHKVLEYKEKIVGIDLPQQVAPLRLEEEYTIFT